ncbi:MAG: CDP-diacylglycerol--serine O-phosphatidyltransferase [Holosporales bacterium]|jgi:CDP-diacylglycerol--serine O-phosphatidyltransferase|nr:CDP-diacylglycerol--serine O-phosphatidyltransferase [Holosporales bacterium]
MDGNRPKRKFRKRSLALTPMSRLMPNVITLMSLCVGFSSVRFALAGDWKYAIACIVGAAIMDGADGRIARLLNSSSPFGAELDSLADFVAFGASPALVLYLFSVRLIGAYGWAICLFYMVCSVLRLARFNIQSAGSPDQRWERKFFTGVPITFAAIIAVTPVILSLEYSFNIFALPAFCSVFMFLSGALMISRLKTFSFKTVKISQKIMLPVMLAIGFVVVSLVTAPWLTIIFVVTVYLLTIPASMRCHKRLACCNVADSPPLTEDR